MIPSTISGFCCVLLAAAFNGIEACVFVHNRYFITFLARNGQIRAVEVRPQKFRANFFRFGRISSILHPKNLLFWGNFAQIERNSPEILGTKLNCADSPISGEKNNYCV
jgi:hypothetical protein